MAKGYKNDITHLRVALCAADGDDKLAPITILEDPCNEEFAPEEGRNDATEPWFDIAKLLA